ncbi:MAG: 4Fe-4S binding protein [Alphaproteobacteria bacterium]|nr:4Fe-4S binding protein [Alphaproteobacteria bacterium]
MKTGSRDQVSDLFRTSYLLDDFDLCVNSRARKVICKACEKACGPQAIKPGVDAIDLNEQDCTTCGACVPVCPSSALRLSVFDPVRFLEAAASLDELHIHCSESRDGGGGIVIPCHLMIDKRLAAVATRGGQRDLILHARPQCHECSRADARAHIPELAKALKRWFGDQARTVRWASPGETTEKEPAQHLDQALANRRNFLKLAGARAISNVSWLIPATPQALGVPEPRAIFVPGEFRRKQDPYQQALAEVGAAFAWRENALLPFLARKISEECTQCCICAERCPTGALGRQHGPGWMGIDYDVRDCTNCGLCTSVCPVSAITAQVLRSWAEVLETRLLLARANLARCEQCGQSFRSDDQKVCPACANEAETDDAWMAMLGG